MLWMNHTEMKGLHLHTLNQVNKQEQFCEIWGFHGSEDSSWGLLGCGTMQCCGRTLPANRKQELKVWKLVLLVWGGSISCSFHWALLSIEVSVGSPDLADRERARAAVSCKVVTAQADAVRTWVDQAVLTKREKHNW